MRPDTLPVTPLASHATLSPEAVRTLFGTSALNGSERVDLVRHGTVLASVPCTASGDTALHIDRLLALDDARGLRFAGPLGTVDATILHPVRSRLVAPSALSRAWGLGANGTVLLGPLAISLPVESGESLALHVETALWQGAGRPETARWAAGLVLPVAHASPDARGADGPLDLPRRVVTETDVRQAILKRRTLRLRPDQIVTPAARSLGTEHDVFA